jgi:hypothetical protein
MGKERINVRRLQKGDRVRISISNHYRVNHIEVTVIGVKRTTPIPSITYRSEDGKELEVSEQRVVAVVARRA